MTDQARNVHQTSSFPAFYFERSLRRLTAKQQIACRNALKVPVMLGFKTYAIAVPARGVRVTPDTTLDDILALKPGQKLEIKTRRGPHLLKDLGHWTAFGGKGLTFRLTHRQRHGFLDTVTVVCLKPMPTTWDPLCLRPRSAFDTDEEFESYGF